MKAKVRTFGRGVRLVQHGCVLSEVLREPGPTHSVFDLLSAAAVVCGEGGRMAMLGFAGGGMMAPLRGMNGGHEVEAVDLDEDGYHVYCQTVKSWGGRLRFAQDDAVCWLRRQRGKFDFVVEDLSVPMERDVVKPEVSFDVLPDLMAKRVKRGGVVISNLLPTPGISMAEMERRVHRVGRACVVELDRFHNRVLVQGERMGTAREFGREVRSVLRDLGSKLGDELTVRALR